MTFGHATATVHKIGPDGVDRRNNPVQTILETFDLVGCRLDQVNSSEFLDGRESIVTRWVLFGPPPPAGKTIGPLDRITIPAVDARTDPDPGETFTTFQLDGQPDHLDHIDGQVHHLEVVLKLAAL